MRKVGTERLRLKCKTNWRREKQTRTVHLSTKTSAHCAKGFGGADAEAEKGLNRAI